MLDRESKDCSVIGEDLTLEGNIVSKSNLLIEGLITGNVTCVSLMVSRGGKIVGDVTCETIHVEGSVNGVVTAARIDLKDGCRLEGDIISESLAVDHGATFIGSSRPPKRASKSDYKEAAAAE